jgi:UDP-2,3-diacylglucosamine pyrophosphatase LpxH
VKKTLIFSDIHIGSKGFQSDKFLGMLKTTDYDRIIMVGDIIDGWAFNRSRNFSVQDIKVIRKLLKISLKKEIIWISGNHDEFLRKFEPIQLGNIHIVNEFIEDGVWYTHGDLFDGVMELKWLGKLGAIGYELAISVDRFFKKLGYKRSVSKWIKDKTKQVIKFVTNFENELIRQSAKRNVHTVVCGHIHKPEDKYIQGVRYLNCGDWVENCTYIIMNNEFKLIQYEK